MFSYETKYCFAVQVVSGYYVYLRTSDGDRLIDHVFDPREAEERCDYISSSIEIALENNDVSTEDEAIEQLETAGVI